MGASNNIGQPRILSKPIDETAERSSRALEERIRQQEILAQLGATALHSASFDQLLAETARGTAEGLHAEMCKVLEHIPSERRFLIRAGVGWEPGVIGASIGDERESPAGFALRSGKPVISNHLEGERRFKTPEVLRRHGVRRAIDVIVRGSATPFGVLEVDRISGTAFFDRRDIAFLQCAANLLGLAIERDRNERKLKAALDRDEALLIEMNHRVKNSLAVVASMLRLQAREAENPQLTAQLNEASHHVVAIGKVHDQLAYRSDLEHIDVGRYLEAVCKDLDESVAKCEVGAEAETGIVIETDRAVSTALIVNELIMNAAKHAYRGESGGKILLRAYKSGKNVFSISVRDEGGGTSTDFDLDKASGLGMRIIKYFAQQLNATIDVIAHDPGAEFVLSVPLRDGQSGTAP